MFPRTSVKNSTIVRKFITPSLLAAPLRLVPFLQEPVLTRLFLSPVRRAPAEGARVGQVVGTLRVGQGLVRVRARGRGPVVMLVHGWQGSSAHFRSMGDALVSAGFTVVTFDMPAHGETRGFSTSLVEFAQTVRGAAHLVGPVHGIVAHSLGATATSLALSRGLSVRAAVLVAPMISFDFALDEFAKTLRLSGQWRELAATGTERRVGITRGEVNLLSLSPPSTRLLLVHDRNDSRVPFSHTEKVKEAWGRGELLATRGFGHRRGLEAPEVIERVLTHFKKAPHSRLEPLSFGCAPEMRI